MVALPSGLPPRILPEQAHRSVVFYYLAFKKQVCYIRPVPVSHLFEHEIYEAANSWMHPLYTLMVRGRFAYVVAMFSSSSELWLLPALQPAGPLSGPAMSFDAGCLATGQSDRPFHFDAPKLY